VFRNVVLGLARLWCTHRGLCHSQMSHVNICVYLTMANKFVRTLGILLIKIFTRRFRAIFVTRWFPSWQASQSIVVETNNLFGELWVSEWMPFAILSFLAQHRAYGTVTYLSAFYCLCWDSEVWSPGTKFSTSTYYG